LPEEALFMRTFREVLRLSALVQRWIVAALRKHTFFSLGEVNQAIRELLVLLNHKPFRKREGTRASLFAALDQPALRPLPAERYEIGQWRKLKVELDYHVPAERHFYSVPLLAKRFCQSRQEPNTYGRGSERGLSGSERAGGSGSSAGWGE
jgi:hypothetical protein